MSITYISRDYGVNVSIVRLTSSDSTATCVASGYITAQAANIAAANNAITADPFTWYTNDMILLSASDGDTFCTINSTFTTLTPYVSLAPTAQTVTVSSATPGTVRAGTFKIVETATTMTSGNIVGVRGEADLVSASGGFVYGVQGKVIPTGTLSGSVWVAPVFGQFDISAATMNAGQTACIWGDYGTSSHTLTDTTGMRGIAMTNTTAAVLNSQDYRYGNATYLLELAGAGGTLNYYLNAGTSAGSAGDAAHCAAQKVIKIEINGAAAYIPVFTQNT